MEYLGSPVVVWSVHCTSIAGKQHHVAHTFMQLVDVVHQYLHLCGNRCRRSHFYRYQIALQRYGNYIKCAIPKNGVLTIAHQRNPAKAG